LRPICLFEFAAHYTLKRKNPVHEDIFTDQDAIEFPEDDDNLDELEKADLRLKNNKGIIKKRKRPFVVNYINFHPIENREEYYYSLLLLYLPFIEENFCDDKSSVDVFKDRHGELRTHQDDPIVNVQLATDIESALVRISELSEEELASANLDERLSREYEEVEAADGFMGSVNEIFPTTPPNALEQIKEMLRNATEEQRQIFFQVKGSIENDLYKDPSRSLKIFTGGCGGTGKSYLLKLLALYIRKKISDDSLIIAAPSGRAAHLVGGITCHKAFSLPIEHETVASYQKLGAKRLMEYRNMYKNVQFIIIDECSMVSYESLRCISRRLNEICECDEPFAGKSVILIGDLMQLPPVKGHEIFTQPAKYSAETHLTHHRLFSFVELHVNKRQENDELLPICNKLRLGELDADDIAKLQTRVLDMRRPNYQEMVNEFKDALRLYPTTAQCDKYNQAKLAEMKSMGARVFNIKAVDTFSDGSKFGQTVPEKLIHKKINKTARIPTEISLCVGSRVMLKKNMSQERGMWNGSTGVIQEFQWEINKNCQLNDGDLPRRIKILFDHRPEPEWIDCIRTEFYGKQNFRVTRRMVAVTLAYALTIHKVQGMSLKKCVVDLGPKLFAKGMAYVAVSRVMALSGLAIECNFSPGKLLSTLKFTPANVSAMDELERLRGVIIIARK
jgi:ATP-dependent DNA helicase PIF1